ncbi:MAG: lipocalin family protein [Gammaproteobacteria bacterium]|nr:lipocalin family protein [Gammaproteobacteria bacterium]
MKLLSALIFLFLTSCVGIPEGVEPVGNFELERYLGKWYEIARLDHSFERGLSQVSANYSMRSDGGVKVINRGYSAENSRWKEAEGKAYFVENTDLGYLKVSFFGPFYGAYIIFELDHENYQYSLVSGPDKSYLWILSRSPKIDENTKSIFIKKAAELGFDTNELIYVNHE